MLYLHQHIGEAQLAIWRLDETCDELLAMLVCNEEIEAILAIKSQSRVREKLAVRVLLKYLLGEQTHIAYHASGRPYLANDSLEIGISHTNNYVAIVLHPTLRVGIDIEQIGERIRRVQSRLISDKEYIDMEQELTHLLLHWSAKEAMFKWLDVEAVDYLDHFFVSHFTPQSEGVFQAQEKRTSSQTVFDEVHYKVEDDFVLVWFVL